MQLCHFLGGEAERFILLYALLRNSVWQAQLVWPGSSSRLWQHLQFQLSNVAIEVDGVSHLIVSHVIFLTPFVPLGSPAGSSCTASSVWQWSPALPQVRIQATTAGCS